MDFPTNNAVKPFWLTIPASRIYEILAEFHHWRFEKTPTRIESVNVPVISVGNITVGGTGKTPCVASLVPILRDMLQRQRKPGVPAILSRGYGRQTKFMRIIEPKTDEDLNWQEVGDEPLLLHQLLPKIPIIVNRNRVAGARAAIEKFKSPVLLMDDGFQHRALKKDLEIVLLDAHKPLGNGYLLPAGPMREPVSALRRADVLVSVGSQITDAVAELADRFGKPLIEASLKIGKPVRFSARKTDTPPEKVVLLSGIARPERFHRTAMESGFRVLDHCLFRDHYPFSQSDISNVSSLARELEAEAIVTTAKDAVRLAGLTFGLPVWILPVEFVWKKPEDIITHLEQVFAEFTTPESIPE
jgi:tetraacyldisaccharide 4'-kinase